MTVPALGSLMKMLEFIHDNPGTCAYQMHGMNQSIHKIWVEHKSFFKGKGYVRIRERHVQKRIVKELFLTDRGEILWLLLRG